ncbi:Asp-tRNA(Asn)/Glu-tRNA(Gln) amidotransferase subunit GatA [Candidatus Pacearchaeota archaeon]|nr:Asp-tRNA(Asn)/Glu-tRNA(Gln) amidotransferase subunit GatA [Candidatus Pacearchaeota archaeon]
MTIKEKLSLIRTRKLSAEENIKQFLEKIERDDKKGRQINAFLHLNKNALGEAKGVDKKIREGSVGKLAGLAIAVKSNMNVTGLPASCASKTLENYKAGYDASVIEKIRKEEGIIIGMTNMDEFACGSSGETSAFGPTKNPASLEKIPGGSSSGSAASVAAEFCDLALGSDTGGSIRNPASHCGIIGVKPSYGLVSRYGLIDLSMSLDQIGPFSQDVYGSALLLNVIAGKDEKDPTTFNEKIPAYHEMLAEKIKINIGISNELQNITGKDVRKKVEGAVSRLKILGWKSQNVDLKHVNLAVQTYYPLVYVEFFSATRRFDGRRYGERIENVAGPEVLRRILGGNEISKAEYKGLYYRRALKAKQLIEKELSEAFKKVDVIISATVPRIPHKIGSSITTEEMYSYDALTIPANLAGICAISIPFARIDGCPIGLQIMAPSFAEARMFQVAAAIENLLKGGK